MKPIQDSKHVPLFIPLAFVMGGLLWFSSCIPPSPDTSTTSGSSNTDRFSDCLPSGQSCGGAKLCCQGEICKGGKCSGDATCAISGGHCSNSGDCCGLATCNSSGVCDTGACQPVGGHCTGSADCCGAGLCRNGFCQ